MTSARRPLSLVGALSALLAIASPSHAQLNRTAVSITGNDANNCAPAAPCRSFTRAISQTNPSGEIVVLDSGGYGAFTIDRAVTVQAAPGVYAGITASAGIGIDIPGSVPASTRIVLRGLTVEGLGTAAAGISVFNATVSIERCVVEGFNFGINGAGTWLVSDTDVRTSRNTAIHFTNAGSVAVIEHTRLKDNSGAWGIFIASGAHATIRDTVITGSDTGIVAHTNTVVDVEDSESSRNLTGMLAFGGGVLRITNSTVFDNSMTGLYNNGGTIESWQNNRVRGNSPDTFGSGITDILTR